MNPLIAETDVEMLVGIIVPIGALLIVFVTVIITGHYRRMQRDDMEATLKMEMIQRGMDAEEIERVLAARMGRYPWHKSRPQSHQPVAHQQPGTHPLGR
jgi:hypothetical protein